jgi:hypothetical protein
MCKFGLMKNLIFIVFVLAVVILSSTSCKKNKLITDSSAKVDFSADSVLFDTVFTTAGSTTRQIRVINNNDQRINISSINVTGGSASNFFLNVDGSPGRSFSDIEIAANDSLFIFIQVNVNPNNLNSPLVISDGIQFVVNGNTQTVYLEAWGQDAYYHKPTNAIKFVQGGYLAYSTISLNTNTTVTWIYDKPHVIYGWLVVDSTQTLIIDPGVKVHFHQNAGLWVYRGGTLKVQGTLNNEVVFQGDRLEPYMQDEPGQWDRIWINEGSKDNSINYAIIKNGFIGIQTELLFGNFSEQRRLKITNTKIQNMKKWGLYSIAYNIYGGNNVISNCKEYCLAIIGGGNYTFIHNTFANFWTKDSRSTPAVHIDNHVGPQQIPLDTCYFANCIIDGSTVNELELDMIGSATTYSINHKFSYCFLRTNISTSDPAHFVTATNKINGTTAFGDPNTYNFKIAGTSSAVNMGNGATTDASAFPLGLDGFPRIPGDGSPDAGAYEKNP